MTLPKTNRLEELKSELEKGGCEVFTTNLDVTKVASIKEAFTHIENSFGVCNVLVNNAGIADSKLASCGSHLSSPSSLKQSSLASSS